VLIFDVFVGQKTNTTTQDITFQKFKRSKDIKDYHFVISESEIKCMSKPAGTFCISGPQLKPRLKYKIVDYMGRWAGCIYQLKGVQFAFISIYQTTYSTFHVPTSIYSQQVSMLLKEGGNICPKTTFQVKVLQNKHIEILLAGDFNTSITSEGVIKALQT
jgi:hypothetical protein